MDQSDVARRWETCLAAKTRLEAVAASSDVSSLINELWREFMQYAAAQDERHSRTAEALRLARNECVNLQRSTREAHDAAVKNLQQAVGAASDLRAARDDSQAAFARQLQLRAAEEERWKTEYAAQMQSVVTNAVRHAREAAQMQHTAALDAALAQASATYREQLSAADASLAELQFHLASALQARDGAASRLAGALAERDVVAEEARRLRAELASAHSTLKDIEARHRELRSELQYRDSSAALARKLDQSMQQLSLAKHGMRDQSRTTRGTAAISGSTARDVRSSTERATHVSEVCAEGSGQAQPPQAGRRLVHGSTSGKSGDLTSESERLSGHWQEPLRGHRHVTYADASAGDSAS